LQFAFSCFLDGGKPLGFARLIQGLRFTAFERLNHVCSLDRLPANGKPMNRCLPWWAFKS
jgi:hypothetical protein